MFERDARRTIPQVSPPPLMKLPQLFRSVTVFMLFVLAVSADAVAQTSAGPAANPAASQVEVHNVRFNAIRVPNSNDSWWEAEVEVAVKALPDSDYGRFVNRVAVTFSIGMEVTRDGKTSHDFFQAKAEAVSIEQGRAAFRFYLPPELVRREKFRGEPKYYLIEISADGVSQQSSSKNVSGAISDATILQSFRSQIASNAAVNDGVLLPQYLTPFAFDSQRRAPSFVRREQK